MPRPVLLPALVCLCRAGAARARPFSSEAELALGASVRGPQPDGDGKVELLKAFALLLLVWSALAGIPLATRPWVGEDRATFLSFGVAAALVLATRRRSAERRRLAAGALSGLGLTSGFAGLPVWVGCVAWIGLGLGLAPGAPQPPGLGGAAQWGPALVLAPVFEELLYRERLLLALRRVMPALPAVATSSALFAVVHCEPWSVLTTLLVGLALGALMLATRSAALCIGLHAGLNLAALVCGVPPRQYALPVPLAALATLGGVWAALLLARRGVGGSVRTTHPPNSSRSRSEPPKNLPCESRFARTLFADPSGKVALVDALDDASAIPETHWVKADATTIETRGGLAHHFDDEGRVALTKQRRLRLETRTGRVVYPRLGEVARPDRRAVRDAIRERLAAG